jgi:hypothetical protein
MKKPALRLIALTAALACAGATHAATAPDPGDYTGLPAGTDLFLMYGYHTTADDVYADGKKVVDKLGLKLDLGLLRYVHFTKWGDYLVDPQIVVPFARQKVGLGDSRTSGLGDVILGGTLWTIADLANGEHLGWSVFVTAPTGADKDEGFAVSDNRWKVELAAGYIRRLAPKWSIDLIPQVELYQDDRSTDVKRDPMLRGFAHLRYHVSDATHLALSYRHAWGAKEKLAGATVKSAMNDGTVLLTAASFLDKQWRLQLQYAHDMQVENGPKTRTIGAQLLYAY